MVAAKPKPQKTVEIDEGWLRSWMDYGFVEMDAYMARSAAFEAYCVAHPRPKE